MEIAHCFLVLTRGKQGIHGMGCGLWLGYTLVPAKFESLLPLHRYLFQMVLSMATIFCGNTFQCEHAMNVDMFDFKLVEKLKPRCKTVIVYVKIIKT
jgi:hypothetical protein